MVAFDNRYDRPIKGTTDWKEYSVVLDVPQNAHALAYGIFLTGTGTAWLNDVRLLEVGSEVKIANSPREKKLPDAPQNLDFNVPHCTCVWGKGLHCRGALVRPAKPGASGWVKVPAS